MANIVYNTLTLSAQKGTVLDQAANLFQDRLDQYSHNNPGFYNTINKDTGSHVCTWEFSSRWVPPFELYAEMKAIKGVSVEATWTDEADHWNTCYRWTGEGGRYEVIETGPTYPTSRSKTTNVVEFLDYDTCRRCGASMQATHNELCEARDGTPTDLDDATVRRLIRQKSIQRGAD